MKAWKAELLLFIVTFIWGGTFVFTKIGLNSTTPSLYVTLRFFIALILSLIIFGKHLKNLSKEVLKNGLILGLLFGGGFVLQTWGLKLTSVTKSAFITGLSVIFTPIVFKFVVKRKIRTWAKVGVVIAFIGLIIFTNPNINHINFGDVLTIISTFFWAFYIVFMDVYTKGKNDFSETVQLVIMQFIGTFAVAFVSHLIFQKGEFIITLDKNLIISLLYNAFIASFLLTLLHTSFQRYTTPVKAALIFSLEPVVATLIAIIILNEILSGREYIGAAILFIGVLISELGDYFIGKNK